MAPDAADPGLLKVVRHNANRHARSVAAFEVDKVFRLRDGRPEERPKAAFALSGNADPGWASDDRPFDVFDAKGIVEALMAELGIDWTLGDPIGRPFHPGRSGAVMVGDERIGVLGELHPRVADRFDLTARVAVAELEVEALMRLARPVAGVEDVPRFPPVRRDLAFVVDDVGPGRPASARRSRPRPGSCWVRCSCSTCSRARRSRRARRASPSRSTSARPTAR